MPYLDEANSGLFTYRAGPGHVLLRPTVPTKSKNYGDTGKERPPFRRKKPSADPGSKLRVCGRSDWGGRAGAEEEEREAAMK